MSYEFDGIASLRSSLFRIFPVPVLGRLSRNTTDLGDGLAGFEHDASPGDLAPLLVRDGDHCGFVDAGVRGDGLFQLKRGDVLTAADNDVLFAIDDEQVAFVVDGGQISGVKPAAAKDVTTRTSTPGMAKPAMAWR